MEYKFRCKEIRKQQGITQQELIERMEANGFYTKRETISMYESGKTTPNADYLAAIAEALGVSVDYLVGGAECKKPDNEQMKKALGLPEESLDELKKRAASTPFENPDIETLGKLIENPDFWLLLREVRGMLDSDAACSDTDKSSSVERGGCMVLTGKMMGDYHRNNAVNLFPSILKTIREGK